MIRFWRSILVLLALLPTIRAEATDDVGSVFLPLAAPGGFAMLPDGVTLIVSQPKTGKLVYFDTVNNAESKQVELDFKPASLVLQDKTLFAASQGSALIYALDPLSGEMKREYNVGGDAISQLACHPAKGLLFATTISRAVYAINPSTGTVVKTAAMGDFLVVDHTSDSVVYTGVKPSGKADEIQVGSNNKFKIVRGTILKYTLNGMELKYVASQKNAALSPTMMLLTLDGERIMMTGLSGWRLEKDNSGGDGIVIFSANNLETMLGQAPFGTSVAFHPVLNLGVTTRNGPVLVLFNSKSLVERTEIHLGEGANMRSHLLTFGGKGTKILLWSGDNPKNRDEDGLYLVPLDLKDEEIAALQKVYGELPKTSGSKTSPSTANDLPDIDPNDVTIAESGFNDAEGLGSNLASNSPYPLGFSNRSGGRGERGWSNPWPPSDLAEFQKQVVQEGDGALHLTGTQNFARRLSRPLTSTFQVEQYVRLPVGGDLTCYVWNGTEPGAYSTGPMWKVSGGKFQVLAGDESGGGNMLDSGLAFKADTWHKVKIVVDVPQRRWEFFVNDKKLKGKPLGFRTKQTSLQELNYLTETKPGAFIDAVRISAASNAKSSKP